MPDATTGKIPFDPNSADIETARQVVFARLRGDGDWHSIDKSGDGFSSFVEYAGQPGRDGRWRLSVLANEVFWQLVVEGILSPGLNYSSPDLPWFHITEYGRKVLASSEPQPYDATGYLAELGKKIPQSDPTVMVYLAESLETFRKGNLVASTVMLGIAAERIFLLLCEALEPALADAREKAEFGKRLKAFPMKPKLDWVHEKIQQIQTRKPRPAGFPENATIMTVAIYDLLRCQRNELGHPRELPPNVTRADAFANLQIFPRFFELAEEVRSFLASNTV